MKKNSLCLTKLAVGLTILLGVLLILYTNQKSFKKIAADDIENISRLSSSIIYAEIDNSLTKPIFVGQTMANDRFLKNWLTDEAPQGNDPAQTAVMQRYLSDYSTKYDYASVFAVSAKSNLYYYQEGVNKVISPANAHDVWYYDFIKSGKSYDLDVDVDEANNNQLTVFVNCKITDDKGELMGVVGVGIKMIHLQELLRQYEVSYDLRTFLMNEDGLIQVDSIDENIEVENFFSEPSILELRDRILGDKTKMQVFWFPEGGADHCLITQYVDNLDWYIVVEKNTMSTQQILTAQINRDLLLIAGIIVLVLLLISYMIAQYNRILLKTASIDDVTNLPNAKMFQEIFYRNAKRPACHTATLFVFDIDAFKAVNDRFGHLFGNTVLYRVSEIAKKVIGSKGVVARWGGDEFVGVIYAPPDAADAILTELVLSVRELREGELHDVTISVGAVDSAQSSDLDGMLRGADAAMYRAKAQGRNCLVYDQ